MSDAVFILNFHGLGLPKPGQALDTGEERYWIEASFFEAILDLVRDRKDVQITFDDSNESDFTVALPALKDRGMAAKFFMVADRIDRNGFLTLGQLQSLVAEGMGIGTHGMRHRPWRGLDEADLREELIQAKERLEQMAARPVTEAACPWGGYDRRVLQALRTAGYQRVYTSDEGPAPVASWLQPRNSIMRTHDLPGVERIVREVPRGAHKMWRTLKLTFKRLR